VAERRARAAARRIARLSGLDGAIRSVRRSAEIEELQAKLAALGNYHLAHPDAPFLRWAPPGHFYSPIPDLDEVARDAGRIFDQRQELPGLDLNADAQLALFAQLAPLARQADFPFERQPTARYYLDNPSFGRGDALMLYAMLRHLRPSRYLEVGSGWTTALALDVSEEHLGGSLKVTCVEPYPEILDRLLRPNDGVRVIGHGVQQAPLELYAELSAGDVLFIDCSHVVKVGSDAHFLITRVLPSVPPGVFVHIHDIFYPFEYPQIWIEEGRAWSEAYLLHAFLLFNDQYEIVLFNDWLFVTHRDLIRNELPRMLENGGGSIWLRRRD